MIHTLRLGIAVIACAGIAIANAANWTPIDKELEQLIELINDNYSGEYKEARTVLYPDESHGYVLTFFAIEGSGGGNNGQMYMAQWWPNWPKGYDPDRENTPDQVIGYSLDGVLQVGSSGTYTISPEQTVFTDDYQIVLHGFASGESDPRCCPSIPISLTYDASTLELLNSTIPN